MEENKSFRFNRRRAEGIDFDDKKQLNLKVRKLNPVNTVSYVQILGTGMDTQDTSPSVLLFFDNQRYIFNAGEGLQRFCTEHRIKLSKINHIFLSRVSSETAGGLPGLLLTLAGMGEEGISVNIWGPSDLKYLIDAMRYFIQNAAMVHTRSFGPPLSSGLTPSPDPSIFRDSILLVDNEVVKMSAFILKPSCLEEKIREEEAVKGREDRSPRASDLDVKTCLALNAGDLSVIYVCELPEIKGKFHPEKAKALGLNPGPKYRELQLGNSVKSDKEDIMVHPTDVMDSSTPGPIVIVVDCPTEYHFQDLLNLDSFNCYYADFSCNQSRETKIVTCIIHLSPVSVSGSRKYQQWMKRFGSAQHIMAGQGQQNMENPTLRASARITCQLNYLCPHFFPAPGVWTLRKVNHSAEIIGTSSEGHLSKLPNCISAENLLKFTLRPVDHLGLDRSCIPNIMTSSEIINELLLELPEATAAAKQIQKIWYGPAVGVERITSMSGDEHLTEDPGLHEGTFPSCLENIRRDDLEVVFLGTGSSQPSKYRNVSSIYINLFSKGSMLLDCGEGTLGQLKRRYGIHEADNAVRSLKCIWISHIHADHHAGLARILALRHSLLRELPHEPLLVIGPRRLERFLDAYQRLEGLDMHFLDCRHTTQASLDDFERVTVSQNSDPGIPMLRSLKKLLNDVGLEALVSFPVVHCPQAFGVVLKAAERRNSVAKVIPGWKIVYSGDTRPCLELIEASRNATLIIHEATFEDGMTEEAIAKNHSTTTEAIEVGASAGVYRIILTHFSQRYPKIPVFDELHMDKTCIAFDMMSVNVADLQVLPKIFPYVKTLFGDKMIDESNDS